MILKAHKDTDETPFEIYFGEFWLARFVATKWTESLNCTAVKIVHFFTPTGLKRQTLVCSVSGRLENDQYTLS